jgi:hypothetical protein
MSRKWQYLWSFAFTSLNTRLGELVLDPLLHIALKTKVDAFEPHSYGKANPLQSHLM